jgi:hypothetical protein
MYVDESDPFYFSILPVDDPDEPMPPSPELQREALDDISCQLITHLIAATNNKSDPAVILAHCDRICDVYVCAGFNLFSEFQHQLRTDLAAALRKARQVYAAQLN